MRFISSSLDSTFMANITFVFVVEKRSVVNPIKASSPFHGCEIDESAFFAFIMKGKFHSDPI